MEKKSWWPLIGGMIALLAYAWAIAPIREVVVDDSYITYRYAENFANGHGPVFNVGERVEGYSNPAWLGLLAIVHTLGLSVPVAAKVLGMLAAMGCMRLTWKIGVDVLELSAPAAWFSTMYLATNIGFAYYSISGMETIFYLMGILGFFYHAQRGNPVLATVFACLMVTTRPEGVMYLVALGFWLFVNRKENGKWWLPCLVPVFVYAVLSFIKHGYYGAWLPNTHAAKIGFMDADDSGFMPRLWALGKYTFSEDAVPIYVWALMMLGAVSLPLKRVLPAVSAVCAAVFFVWYSGGDWMSFQRFYVPVLPLMALMAFASADFLHRHLDRGWQRHAVWLVCLMWLMPNLQATRIDAKRLLAGEHYNPAMNSRPHVIVADYLRDHTQPGDVIVVNEIGAIAYVGQRDVVDMLGLTDKVIPTFFPGKQYDKLAAYVLARNPKYVLLNDKQATDSTEMHPIHKAIHEQMMSSGRYVMERSFALNKYKNLLAFVRKDEPAR